MGYDIELTIESFDLHEHTRYDENWNALPKQNLVCVYKQIYKIGKIGTVILKKIPITMGDGYMKDLEPFPIFATDPCLIPRADRIVDN